MNIISIHSAPRSGSTWLETIFEAHPNVITKYQPLFCYDFKNCINKNSVKEDFDNFINCIMKSNNEFMNRSGVYHTGNSNHIPKFKKDDITTLVMKHVHSHHLIETFIKLCPNIKIIGLIRNPCATINSFVNNPREYDDTNNPDEWLNGNNKNMSEHDYFGYQKWKEVIDIFHNIQNKYPDNIYIVQYEKLVFNSKEEIPKLFAFANLIVTESVYQFINESHNSEYINDHCTSVYKDTSVTDKWKDKLDINIQNTIINDIKNTVYEQYFYQ